MVNLKGSRDIGNSPKNRLVQAVALETGEFLRGVFADDMEWHHRTDTAISGIDAIGQELTSLVPASSIVVEHAISHGKVGAASGYATLADGELRRFCHIIEFTNTSAGKIATRDQWHQNASAISVHPARRSYRHGGRIGELGARGAGRPPPRWDYCRILVLTL